MSDAWQIGLGLRRNAIPQPQWDDKQNWNDMFRLRKSVDDYIRSYWHSEAMGSGAPECAIAAAIQSVENKGCDVSEAEGLFPTGIAAWKRGDVATLHRITSLIMKALSEAPRDQNSPYWAYSTPQTWDEHVDKVIFPSRIPVDAHSRRFAERVHAGWLAQICGGALGTALEGYTTDRLLEAYGDITDYVRAPNTLNDDITYELAFLKAFDDNGYRVKSDDIAAQWVALIPFGWSAEDIALKNLNLGIYPPESARRSNPFSEWIGAQMRGAVCGLVAPGNPKEAARLAWVDGVVSHEGNGVLGEVFNAVMTSMAFVRSDLRGIVEAAIDMLPAGSEYHSVVARALEDCRRSDGWREAWRCCEKRLEKYSWVHAYPNASAEVIALWFGEGDFDETLRIIALEGQDVDCNAAQIATVMGVALGAGVMSERWTKPIGDRLQTYVRGMEEMTISGLARWTVELVRKWAGE